MAQGEFTKEEAERCTTALNEVMTGIPAKYSMLYLGELNDVFLFIAAAKKAAPSEKKQ